jgi:hypothetical protein
LPERAHITGVSLGIERNVAFMSFSFLAMKTPFFIFQVLEWVSFSEAPSILWFKYLLVV